MVEETLVGGIITQKFMHKNRQETIVVRLDIICICTYTHIYTQTCIYKVNIKHSILCCLVDFIKTNMFKIFLRLSQTLCFLGLLLSPFASSLCLLVTLVSHNSQSSLCLSFLHVIDKTHITVFSL